MGCGELFVNEDDLLIVYKELAVILDDLNEAIVLNQLNYWLDKNRKKERNFIDGKYWVYNTYANWKEENFPFWSEKTIQRTFTRLEKKGLVITANFNGYVVDKTKWYTINYDALDKMVKEYRSRQDRLTTRKDNLSRRGGQNDRAIPENTNRDYSTETTDKDLRSVNDLSLQENTGNIYTPDSANPGESSADLPDETGIETVVSEVVDDLGIEQSETKDISEDINTLITTFNTLSTDKPRNLTKTGLSKITYGYLMPPENMDDAGIDDYMAMLKEYFKTDFGARGRYKGKITRSLEHFMSDGIRSRLYERCRQNE